MGGGGGGGRDGVMEDNVTDLPTSSVSRTYWY